MFSSKESYLILFILFGQDSAETPGDQRGDVGEDAGEDEAAEAAGAGEVAGLPDAVEFVFVVAQALEVVEVLAVTEDEGSEPAAERGEGSRFEAGEGGYGAV